MSAAPAPAPPCVVLLPYLDLLPPLSERTEVRGTMLEGEKTKYWLPTAAFPAQFSRELQDVRRPARAVVLVQYANKPLCPWVEHALWDARVRGLRLVSVLVPEQAWGTKSEDDRFLKVRSLLEPWGLSWVNEAALFSVNSATEIPLEALLSVLNERVPEGWMPSEDRAEDRLFAWDFARDCVKKKQFDRAQGPLLALWRASRAPEIANLLELFPARSERPKLPEKKGKQERWLRTELLGNPADFPHLLEALETTLQQQVAKNVEVLSSWQDDPRVSRVLLRYMQEGVFAHSYGQPFWGAALRWMISMGDVRVLQEFFDAGKIPGKDFKGSSRERMEERLLRMEPLLRKQCAALRTPLFPGEKERCDELAQLVAQEPVRSL